MFKFKEVYQNIPTLNFSNVAKYEDGQHFYKVSQFTS